MSLIQNCHSARARSHQGQGSHGRLKQNKVEIYHCLFKGIISRNCSFQLYGKFSLVLRCLSHLRDVWKKKAGTCNLLYIMGYQSIYVNGQSSSKMVIGVGVPQG